MIIGSTRTAPNTGALNSTALNSKSAQGYSARLFAIPLMLAYFTAISACSPTVRVEPSDKPITINLNVKIEHEIRVKVDKELDSILSEDSGLF